MVTYFSESPRCQEFLCGLLKEKLDIMIDFAFSQGGTSTTGHVARRCLIGKNNSEKDFLYWYSGLNWHLVRIGIFMHPRYI